MDKTRAKRLPPASLTRYTALQLIQPRSERDCHTFRATGITAFLLGGPALSGAQSGTRIAAHESPRTTSLYDRRSQEVELDEIERIRI